MQLTTSGVGGAVFGLLVLVSLIHAQEGDPREGSKDPWLSGLPDASELVSGNLDSNFPDWGINEDGTLPADPAEEAEGAMGGQGGSSESGGAAGQSPSPSGGGRSALVSVQEAEPNGDFGSAQSVSSSAQITGTIAPQKDYDWFGFDIKRRGTLEVSFSNVPAPLNPAIRVHNGNGSAMTNWIEPKGQEAGTVITPIHLKTSGRYYIVVADGQSDAQSTSAYELKLDFIEGDRFEPNESYGTKTSVSDQARLQGTILPQGDIDCYSFNIERRGSMEVWFKQVPQDIDPSFRLYNAEGSAISSWQTLAVRDNATQPVVIDLPKAGAYHIAVADSNSDSYSEHPYALYLTMHLGDANEWNESIGTATEVGPTAHWQSSLLPRGDHDVYRFKIPNQGITTASLSQVPDELLPSLRLHNANGTAITSWRKTSLKDGRSDPMIFDLGSPGQYYLAIANDSAEVRSFDSFGVALQFQAGDGYEPNAGIGQATDITRGSAVSGSILPRGDYDHYRVEVNTPGKVSIVFSSVPESMTPSVRILNPSGTAITSWNRPAIRDGASTPIEIDIKTPGRYFVVVADHDGQAFGVDNYTFQVQ